MSVPAALVEPRHAVSSSDASVRHLLGRLAVVEARVKAAVARRRRSDPNPDDGFRGLYITCDQVDAMLSEAKPLDASDPGALELLCSVEADADSAESQSADLRLRRLERDFRLHPLDVEMLLIALAPDLDTRFERLFGYLHDDVSRRRPSIGLCLELCGVDPTSGGARSRFAATQPLVGGRLILIEDPDRPFLTRSIRVPDRVCSHLLGDDTLDPSIGRFVDVRPTDVGTVAGDQIVHHTEDANLVYIRDCPGSRGLATALSLVTREEGRALVVNLDQLPPECVIDEFAGVAGREARLLGTRIVAAPVDALTSRGSSAVRPFTELGCPVVLMGMAPWDPAWSLRIPHVWAASRMSAAERAGAWRRELGSAGAGVAAGSATAQYRLDGEQVARAAAAARLRASASGRPLTEEDLRFGARSQNSAGLDRLARRYEPIVRLADVILPAEQLALLRDVIIRARHRETVLNAWRVGGPTAARRGLTALFCGPPGTGKTMAAEAIAAELDLDLCAIDLATVVDKYIGETEKNLDRIFRESERVNCVLLFDEADALFGKRSDVNDAHDRYANVETAYLLQQMERFAGVAILATNLRANLDPAFSRRLDVIVDFPEPDEEQRLGIWQRCLDSEVPQSRDVDLTYLARSFTLSGGDIRNVTVSAAFLAAERDSAVSMEDLILATQREYRKLGRLYAS